MVTTTENLQKIAEGREAEMFAWEDGKILRLFRGDFLRSTIEFQTNVLSDIAAAGIRVPTVYETIEIDGRTGVVMERIDGVDLLTQVGRKPWTVWSIGRISGKAQAEVNATLAPDSLPTTHQRYTRIIQNSALIPQRYAEAALVRLAELPEGDRLIHGDFHPGNIMVQDGQPVIIDWSNATRGNPEVDLVRTNMMMSLGDPPPGTAATTRVLAKFGRFILRDAHARAYMRVRQPDEVLAARWALPIAVGRLAEEIQAERKSLDRYIERLLNDTRSAAP